MSQVLALHDEAKPPDRIIFTSAFGGAAEIPSRGSLKATKPAPVSFKKRRRSKWPTRKSAQHEQVIGCAIFICHLHLEMLPRVVPRRILGETIAWRGQLGTGSPASSRRP